MINSLNEKSRRKIFEITNKNKILESLNLKQNIISKEQLTHNYLKQKNTRLNEYNRIRDFQKLNVAY